MYLTPLLKVTERKRRDLAPVKNIRAKKERQKRPIWESCANWALFAAVWSELLSIPPLTHRENTPAAWLGEAEAPERGAQADKHISLILRDKPG